MRTCVCTCASVCIWYIRRCPAWHYTYTYQPLLKPECSAIPMCWRFFACFLPHSSVIAESLWLVAVIHNNYITDNKMYKFSVCEWPHNLFLLALGWYHAHLVIQFIAKMVIKPVSWCWLILTYHGLKAIYHCLISNKFNSIFFRPSNFYVAGNCSYISLEEVINLLRDLQISHPV